jgi:surface antigen
MRIHLIAGIMLPFLTCQWALGQQSTAGSVESHRYRTILTVAGGGGGFALGTFAGLAAFDDAINSDRKVWTTAALSAAGGAVAGYFIGRALDKRPKKTTVTQMREELEKRSKDIQWLAPQSYGSVGPRLPYGRAAFLYESDGFRHEGRSGLDRTGVN